MYVSHVPVELILQTSLEALSIRSMNASLMMRKVMAHAERRLKSYVGTSCAFRLKRNIGSDQINRAQAFCNPQVWLFRAHAKKRTTVPMGAVGNLLTG